MRPAHALPMLAAAAVLTVVAGCTAGGGYADPQNRFRLDPPSGWDLHAYSSNQPCLVLVGPEAPAGDGTDAEPGRPNINIVVLPCQQGWTLTRVLQLHMAEVRGFGGFELVAEADRTLADGTPSREVTFRHAACGPSVTVRQVLAMAAGRVYTVTASARTDRFERVEPVFEACLRSFRAGT